MTDKITCAVCGFANAANVKRCVACGAKLEALARAELSAEEQFARRHQQDTFEWKWVGISFSVYIALQGLVLGILPVVIDRYDPEGFAGLAISVLLWFLGGLIVGLMSPGKTFIEPAVGALIAVVPTIAYLQWYSQVQQLSVLGYIVGGMLGVMVTLFGSFLGERIQMGTRGHAA